MEGKKEAGMGLECAVCLDSYRDPRVLACGHSFCFACIQANSAADNASSCPICREESIPKADKVQDLLKNFALCATGANEGLGRRKNDSEWVLQQQRKRRLCPECGDAVQRERIYRCTTDGTLACIACHYDRHSDHPRQSLGEWHSEVLKKETEPLMERIRTIASLADETDALIWHTRRFQRTLKFFPEIFESSLSAMIEKKKEAAQDLQPPSLAGELNLALSKADLMICHLSEHIHASLERLHASSNHVYNLLKTLSGTRTGLDSRLWQKDEVNVPGQGSLTASVSITGNIPNKHHEENPEMFQQPNWNWASMREKRLLDEGGHSLLFGWFSSETFPVSLAHVKGQVQNCRHSDKPRQDISRDFVRPFCLTVPPMLVQVE